MKMRDLQLDCDPIEALRRASALPGVSLLHSGMQAYGLGRYTILAARPWKTLTCRGGEARVEQDGAERSFAADPFEALRLELPREAEAGELPFSGGAIGYVAYDAARQLERLPALLPDDGAPDARFAFYKGAVVFDHQTGHARAVCRGEAWDEVVEELVAALQSRAAPQGEPFRLAHPIRNDVTRGEFIESVNRIRELIRDGEVYQVNLSQRFDGACSGSAAELFARLARASPAPYAAYLDFGDEQIVSSSPERFLFCRDGFAQTRPIKGTRPRGQSEVETLAYEAQLRESEKERAELLMIVDLERNDLGRVCRPGSVDVDGLFGLERYATVIHQTATVSGRLEEGLDGLDCARALFPGGSITGAPKIRAMEIIERLERSRRGIYTGAIGYVDASGAIDLSIAIRTLRVAGGNVSFRVGGGIVWDSDPESEYEETLVKAKAMFQAIGGESAR